MEELIRSWIYSILVSGCVCSMLLFINADSKSKPLLETGCACIMVLVFISPIMDIQKNSTLHLNTNIWSMAEYDSFNNNSYIRAYMESEYCAYILKEADQYNIVLSEVLIGTIQDENGNWIPHEIYYTTEQTDIMEFKRHIENQLGVTEERQHVNASNVIK